jgi:hypothetical protein
MTKKFRITLQADLETDNYNEDRMDTSICFIATNTDDVIENFHNYLDLLTKCGLADNDEEITKYEPGITEGVL